MDFHHQWWLLNNKDNSYLSFIVFILRDSQPQKHYKYCAFTFSPQNYSSILSNSISATFFFPVWCSVALEYAHTVKPPLIRLIIILFLKFLCTCLWNPWLSTSNYTHFTHNHAEPPPGSALSLRLSIWTAPVWLCLSSHVSPSICAVSSLPHSLFLSGLFWPSMNRITRET